MSVQGQRDRLHGSAGLLLGQLRLRHLPGVSADDPIAALRADVTALRAEVERLRRRLAEAEGRPVASMRTVEWYVGSLEDVDLDDEQFERIRGEDVPDESPYR